MALRHPLTTAVAAALARQRRPGAAAFLALLDERLARLSAFARGAPGSPPPPSATSARRFLAGLEGAWDDGDENLVRGQLERWVAPGTDAAREAARSLLETADALARIEARPGTLYFFLWELESLLGALAEAGRNDC